MRVAVIGAGAAGISVRSRHCRGPGLVHLAVRAPRGRAASSSAKAQQSVPRDADQDPGRARCTARRRHRCWKAHRTGTSVPGALRPRTGTPMAEQRAGASCPKDGSRRQESSWPSRPPVTPAIPGCHLYMRSEQSAFQSTTAVSEWSSTVSGRDRRSRPEPEPQAAWASQSLGAPPAARDPDQRRPGTESHPYRPCEPNLAGMKTGIGPSERRLETLQRLHRGLRHCPR